jgi:hypothetical protein
MANKPFKIIISNGPTTTLIDQPFQGTDALPHNASESNRVGENLAHNSSSS